MQNVDLYQPIAASRIGPAPVALRVVLTPSADSFVDGVPAANQRTETYVLLSALPEELQDRVRLAIQALLAGR